MLVNAITAEYIHTLKVTGRKGGLYTSTVMNNKPSSISTHLLVKDKKVRRSICIQVHSLNLIHIFLFQRLPHQQMYMLMPVRIVILLLCHGQCQVVVIYSVIGYQLYYQHVNTVTTINISSHNHTAVFTEGNERVYSVSIQSLSEHLPSDLVGPIIARGKSDNNVLSCLISL